MDASPHGVDPQAPKSSGVGKARFRWLSRTWRPALFVFGVGALVALVHAVGIEAVAHTLAKAGPWIPLILALEVLWVFIEGGALLALYGESRKQIPGRALFGAFLLHMSTMLVLPVGRAGAEVARGTVLAKFVGGARATSGSVLMQALTLLTNTAVSLLCAMVAWRLTAQRELSIALLVNGSITLVIGGLMMVATRHGKLGAQIGRRISKLSALGPEIDESIRETRSRQGVALTFCFTARLVQAVQYGVIFAAVTSTFSGTKMFVAQGIHLVGAGMGDMVPNQVGVSEGVFRFFADDLGLGSVPEQAVAIALLARLSAVGAAGLGFLVLQFLPRGEPRELPLSVADVSTGS